jgi:hypothetical protein
VQDDIKGGKMKVKILILGLVVLFSISCVSMRLAETSEEKTYLEKVMAMPLIFDVSKEKSEETWGRIQSFIGKYSPVRIQTVTDYIIETYDAKIVNSNFSYSAIRTPKENKVEFEVKCFITFQLPKMETAGIRNAHMMAYYALTGEVMEKFVCR